MKSTENLRHDAIKGLAWNAFGRIGAQVLNYLITFYLIRLLLPGDFGLMAILLIFISFMTLFLDFGLGAAIVQSPKISEKEINTIGTFNLLFGWSLLFLFCFSANSIALFFKEPILESLIYVISLGFCLNALIIVPRNLHIKKLLFKKVSIIELTSVVFSGSLAIYLALNGYGVWALVFQFISKVFIEAICYFIFTIQVPKLSLNFNLIKSHLKFSSTIFGSSLLLQIADNLDSVIIGRVFLKDQLGIYNKSSVTARMPSKLISSIIARVMFPSFSLIQNDVKRIANSFLRIHKLVLALTIPFMLFFMFFAEELVLFIAGKNWIEAAPLIRIFAFSGIARSVIALLGPVILSLKNEKYIWRSALYKNVLLILGILCGFQWGIYGIAIGKTVADYIFLIIFFYYIFKVLHLHPTVIFKSLGKVFIASLVLISFFLMFNATLIIEDILVKIIVNLLGGIIVYLLMLKLLKEREVFYLKSLVTEFVYGKK